MSNILHVNQAGVHALSEFTVTVLKALEYQALARRMGNACVWACRLPLEILGEIFLFVQAKDEDAWDWGWHPRRVPPKHGMPLSYEAGWMTVTHVCAAWRKVALSMPTLWYDIHVLNTPLEHAEELLRRSAGLPLRLRYDEFEDGEFEGFEACNLQSMRVFFSKPVLSRLKELVIRFLAITETQRVLLTQEAPMMRTLSMVNDGPPTVLTNLLGPTCPPHFRKLGLSLSTLPTNFSLLTPGLTHLKLMDVGLLTDRGQSPAAQALSALSILTELEYLHLSNFPQSEITTSGITLHKLDLPSTLRYMYVHIYTDRGEPFESALELAEHLASPATTELRINVQGFHEFNSSVCRQMLNGVGADIHGGDSLLELQLRGTRQCCLHRRDATTKDRAADISMNLELERRKITAIELLNSLASPPRFITIPSSYWKEIAVRKAAEFNPWSDISLLGRDAVCLTVYYSDHVHLWSLLRDDPAQFPLLDTIVLTSIDYSCKYHDELSLSSGGYMVEFFEDECEEYETEVDTSVLPDLISGLREATEARRQSAAQRWKVRIEGWWLAEWDGWDEVSDVVNIEW